MRALATVARPAARVHYPRRTPVEATARAMRCTPATASQYLKPAAPECPFTRAARITEALLTAGHAVKVDLLCLPLDLVRQASLVPDVTPEAFAAALEAEQVAEGRETTAQLFIRDAASYATWRKRAVTELTATMRAIRLGDALYGRDA